MGGGAGNLPLYYEGEWDAGIDYLPRQIVTLAGVAYMAIQSSGGFSPPTRPDLWLPFGGGAAPITAANQQRTEGYNTGTTAIGTGATYVPLATVDSLPLNTGRDGGGSGAYASPWAHRNVGANHLTIDEEGLYDVAVYAEGNVTGGYMIVSLYESTSQAAWAPKETILPGSGGVVSLSADLVLAVGDQVGLQAQRLGGATAANITLYRLSLIKLQ